MSDCKICLSSAKDRDEYKLNGEHKFCKECLEEHLKYRVYKKMVANGPSCARKCNQKEVLELMSNELKIKYEDFQTQIKVDQDQNLHWCPRTDCNNYVEVTPNPQGEKKQAVCQCGYEFCINGHCSWHPNKSGNRARDKDSRKITKKYAKRCPQCKSPIEKIEGCNHMKGEVCHHEFCWICGEPYAPSHLNGFSSCAFETNNSCDIPLMMLMLPLILFIIPSLLYFQCLQSWSFRGKLMKGAKYGGFALLVLLVTFPLGILIQVFLPLGWILLIILWVKIQIKKLRYKN